MKRENNTNEDKRMNRKLKKRFNKLLKSFGSIKNESYVEKIWRKSIISTYHETRQAGCGMKTINLNKK